MNYINSVSKSSVNNAMSMLMLSYKQSVRNAGRHLRPAVFPLSRRLEAGFPAKRRCRRRSDARRPNRQDILRIFRGFAPISDVDGRSVGDVGGRDPASTRRPRRPQTSLLSSLAVARSKRLVSRSILYSTEWVHVLSSA